MDNRRGRKSVVGKSKKSNDMMIGRKDSRRKRSYHLVHLLALICISWEPAAAAASSSAGGGGWLGKIISGGQDDEKDSSLMYQNNPEAKIPSFVNQSRNPPGTGRGMGMGPGTGTPPPLPPGNGFPPPPPSEESWGNQINRHFEQDLTRGLSEQQTLEYKVNNDTQSTDDEELEKDMEMQEEDGNEHMDTKNGNDENESFPQFPPPPPPISDDGDGAEDLGGSPSWGNPNSWGNPPSAPYGLPPPPPGYEEWREHQMIMAQQHHQQWQGQQDIYQQQQQQQQQQQPYFEQHQEEQLRSLQAELEAVLNQQNQLYTDIQNLTSTVTDLEHLNEIRLSKIDVLSERVADAEAHASAESNAALEYKTNCTSLAENIRALQLEMEEYEEKCNNLMESHQCDQDEINKLKKQLKEREMDLEELACGIEIKRVEDERERYIEEMQKRKAQKSGGGLFSWLFGWMVVNNEEDSDEDEERLQELARSTLLNALQTERNNVHELEALTSTLQQNNSAILDMVSSRDYLIDELNDRVAVFEEDKIVLKAALRQLQKEMKEEAPKTQKLVTDLKLAKEEIDKVCSEMQSIQAKHKRDIEEYNLKLSEKENLIKETDSKMSLISTYVDQLEERLASFAIARRDIGVREEKCKDLEEKRVQDEKERDVMQNEMTKIHAENEELKNLADLLVQERAVLQKEKNTLQSERDSFLFEGKSLRDQIEELNNQFVLLQAEAEEMKINLDNVEVEKAEVEDKLRTTQSLNEEMEKKVSEQDEVIRSTLASKAIMEEEMKDLLAQKEQEFVALSSSEEKNRERMEEELKQLILERDQASATLISLQSEMKKSIEVEMEKFILERDQELIEVASSKEENDDMIQLVKQKVNDSEESVLVQDNVTPTLQSSPEEERRYEEGYDPSERDSETFESEHYTRLPSSPILEPNDADNHSIEVTVAEENEVSQTGLFQEILPPPPPPPNDSENNFSFAENRENEPTGYDTSPTLEPSFCEINEDHPHYALSDNQENTMKIDDVIASGVKDREHVSIKANEGDSLFDVNGIDSNTFNVVDQVEEIQADSIKDDPELPESIVHQMHHPRKPVPFRQIRKAFSRVTGMHGFFATDTKQKRNIPQGPLLLAIKDKKIEI